MSADQARGHDEDEQAVDEGAEAVTARERVAAHAEGLAEAFGRPPLREEVAASLVDEDVANGEYEGCSTELELAYCEYLTLAGDVPALIPERRAA